MKRFALLIACLGVGGCSNESDLTLTGDDAAVAGLPRHRTPDRFLIESCCTLKLGPGVRAEPLQGIDSVIHDVSGPDYVLNVVFGPYDSGQPDPGYVHAGKTSIDGVELTALGWTDRDRKPPEGRLLWLAQVGGGRINGMKHTPWGLRLRADCDTPAACRASAALIDTIRF